MVLERRSEDQFDAGKRGRDASKKRHSAPGIWPGQVNDEAQDRIF